MNNSDYTRVLSKTRCGLCGKVIMPGTLVQRLVVRDRGVVAVCPACLMNNQGKVTEDTLEKTEITGELVYKNPKKKNKRKK